MSQIFVLFDGPDMTYYGDAAVYGVYSSQEAAEEAARKVKPTWTDSGFETMRIEPSELDADPVA